MAVSELENQVAGSARPQFYKVYDSGCEWVRFAATSDYEREVFGDLPIAYPDSIISWTSGQIATTGAYESRVKNILESTYNFTEDE
jgi:hypothetical protein